MRQNANGQLRIQGDVVQFEPNGRPSAQVSSSSIQDISLGTEDKQIGGVPMTLGKAAVPFEGARPISLFTLKQYDTFTLEYLNNNGGFHGAIFQMNKGQGQASEKDLVAKGAHIAPPEIQVRTQRTPQVKAPEVKHEINRASSVRSSPAATKTTFSLSAFLRSKLRSRAVAVLILLLSGLQFQLCLPTALAQDSTVGKNGTAGGVGDDQQWSVQVDKVDPWRRDH